MTVPEGTEVGAAHQQSVPKNPLFLAQCLGRGCSVAGAGWTVGSAIGTSAERETRSAGAAARAESGDCGVDKCSLASWAGGRAVLGQRLETWRESCRVVASPSIGNRRRRRRSQSTDSGSGGGIGDNGRW